MTKKPLFKLSWIVEDLRVRGLSMLAQLLFTKICVVADEAGGFLHLRGRILKPEDLPDLLGFRCGGAELSVFLAEIVAMGLIEDKGGAGWCVPEMVKAAELRAKRQDAGKKGGKAAQAKIVSVAETGRKRPPVPPLPEGAYRPVICSSKSTINATPTPKRQKNCGGAAELSVLKTPQQKEKNQKKNINNNIYIISELVFTGDRGSEENPAYCINDNFTVYRREWEAMLRVFPTISADRLLDLMAQHDRWLDREENLGRPWLPCLLAFLKHVHNKLAAAA